MNKLVCGLSTGKVKGNLKEQIKRFGTGITNMC